MMQSVIRAIYPPQCLSCGSLTQEEFALCPACWPEGHFIDALACHACGLPLLGADEGVPAFCDSCLMHPRPWTRGRAVALYDGRMRELVLALKHGDRTDLARPLGLWMARRLGQVAGPEERPLLVPVPLHPLRLWRRRYNQAALLVQAMVREGGFDHCLDALRRNRRTPSLKSADLAARFVAVAQAFTVPARRRALIAGRLVVLVDDVMTSGATLSVAAEALLSAGAREIRVLVLARTGKAP